MDDLKRYLIDETVEDFAEGRITRRQAMATLARLTGTLIAAELLGACRRREPTGEAPGPVSGSRSADGLGSAAPRGPAPDSVAPGDHDVIAAPTSFTAKDATLTGYLARPSRAGMFPIVLVCHENRGLTPYIEDVTRRLAKTGYVGVAVDLLSREGGTAKQNADAVPGLLGNAPPARHVGDFIAGLAHARAQPSARRDRVGMIGFCFGGGVTWRVAAALSDLRAAIPYYGMPIEPDQVPSIQAAVLGIYAEHDERINSAVPPVEEAMHKAGKTFRKIVYPGTQHAFHNDTRERYNPSAAQAAWRETLAWFATHLA